ncbi:MAG TPA: single-stranded DNA-binding protein [Longimicrobiaceae bacterium]|nr:single-stranded DNA-binding protein [Longimicrobiaceae bacterium]
MARSLNKAMLIGNLGQDPEIRTTPGGVRVAQFSLATSRRWNDKNGQQQEKTEWHKVICWDRLVEIIEKYVKKGDRLYVEGEIEYRQYEDKEGQTRYVTEIRAREVLLLGGREGGGGDYGDRGGGYTRQQPAASRAGAGGSGGGGAGGRGGADYDDYQAPALDEDDDLPF